LKITQHLKEIAPFNDKQNKKQNNSMKEWTSTSKNMGYTF